MTVLVQKSHPLEQKCTNVPATFDGAGLVEETKNEIVKINRQLESHPWLLFVRLVWTKVHSLSQVEGRES